MIIIKQDGEKVRRTGTKVCVDLHIISLFVLPQPEIVINSKGKCWVLGGEKFVIFLLSCQLHRWSQANKIGGATKFVFVAGCNAIFTETVGKTKK